MVENAPIWWLNTDFATPSRFRCRSRAVSKRCYTSAGFLHACEKKYFSALWWEMPQFDGWAQILWLWRIFACVLGHFKKLLHDLDFFDRMRKKYFSALWWGIPQFDGWAPILRHWRVFACVLGMFRKAASRAQFFQSHAKKYFSAWWWGMPQFDGWAPILRHWHIFACILGQFQKATSRAWFFRSHAKKIFLSIVVENAPIRWLGTDFVTPTSFRLRSRAVLKSCFTSAIFLSHAKKNIFWRCGGECHNLMVGHKFCNFSVFSIAF